MRVFPPQKLSQGTKHILRNSETKPAFLPEEPAIVPGGRKIPTPRLVLTEGSGSLALEFVGLILID